MEILGVYASLLLPIIIIVVYSLIRFFMGIHEDTETDLIVSIVTFDVICCFGFMPGFEKILIPEISKTPQLIAMLGAFISFILSIISLKIKKFSKIYNNNIDRNQAYHLKKAIIVYIIYLPCIIVIFMHMIAFGVDMPSIEDLLIRFRKL